MSLIYTWYLFSQEWRMYPFSWTPGPGRRSRSKNFKTPPLSRYQKLLQLGNSNKSKPRSKESPETYLSYPMEGTLGILKRWCFETFRTTFQSRAGAPCCTLAKAKIKSNFIIKTLFLLSFLYYTFFFNICWDTTSKNNFRNYWWNFLNFFSFESKANFNRKQNFFVKSWIYFSRKNTYWNICCHFKPLKSELPRTKILIEINVLAIASVNVLLLRNE